MNLLRKLGLIGLLVACLLSQAALASVIDGPGLSLFAFNGERQIDHAKGDPLLLYVMIDNTAAAIAERDNQANKKIVEQFSETDAYNAMTESELQAFNKRYAIREVPRVTLGSGTVSLESLINIQVRNGQGDAVDLKIRPLAANEQNTRKIELKAHESQFYQFVVEDDELTNLPPGTYHLAAGIDTRKQMDMWQGWTFSKTLTVNLTDQAADSGWVESDQRALLVSTFLIEDRQYPQAEVHARAWTQRNPKSVDAWGQLGESLYGQQKHQQAFDSFSRAVANFRKKYGDNPRELPLELLDRMDQIEMETGIRPPLDPNDPVPDENTPKPENLEEGSI